MKTWGDGWMNGWMDEGVDGVGGDDRSTRCLACQSQTLTHATTYTSLEFFSWGMGVISRLRSSFSLSVSLSLSVFLSLSLLSRSGTVGRRPQAGMLLLLLLLLLL